MAGTLAIPVRDATHPDTVPMHGSIYPAFLIVFALLVAVQVCALATSGRCMQCGGKGAHKEDCPKGKP